MSGRDWDKELAKIDKQLGMMSDDQLGQRPVPSSAGAVKGSLVSRESGASITSGPSDRRTLLGVAFRVGLAVALAAAVPFWPYASRCGMWLAGYLGAVSVVVAAGAWATMSTWRARMGKTHIVALLVIAWGLSLAAVEVLPRVGYANDDARGAWFCR